MNRRLERSSAHHRLLPSLLGAVAVHVAVLVSLSQDGGVQPLPPRTVTYLGVEVSLDSEPEKSELGQKDDLVDPSAAPEPVRAAPLPLSAGLGERKESAAAAAVASEEGLTQSEGGPSEDDLSGLFGESGIEGVRSARLRGVRRASLQGRKGSLGADQRARLAPGGTACADLFPYEAGVSRGEVTATLDVDASGRAKLVKLERANPTARGFEVAASVCAKRLRFEPARDAAGRTVTSIAQVKLVFQRQS